MFKNYYIILPVILVLIYILYNIIIYYKKKFFVQTIIEEWKRKTNGHIRCDHGKHYSGDYYLSPYRNKNSDTHIHLITEKRSFVKVKESETFRKCTYLCYIIKRNDIHSQIHYIDENKSSEQIVYEMLENYNEFHI
jgi:hypothetical protein